ncbi:leucine-rich repeat domain-containing protein [Flavobacterium microcysteis]|uniref:TIR domain-containing protein n=1 Tax=Flavobacterium microcysteis TaxID=2596891 RepID=A0A501QC36_9FLAO|nr:leucine-rich repeat domain-containing protein [Flavobacterium microcysteis]TPD70490.1 TIR domain-containing protein [Flavobacterium microcysteis]
MESTKPEIIISIEERYNLKLEKLYGFQNITDHPQSYKIDENNNITEINLNNCRLISLHRLRYLKSLKKICLAGNSIRNIETLEQLTELEYLDVSNNKIEDISILKQLISLRYLNISNNRVYDISPIYDHLKNDLYLIAEDNPTLYPSEKISINRNGDVIEWFNYLWRYVNNRIEDNLQTKEEILDLGNCGITDLSRFPLLYKCTHLKVLILSNEWAIYDGTWYRRTSLNEGLPNNIFHVPSEFSNLQNLEHLIVGGDWNSKKNNFWNRWRIKNFSIFNKLSNLKYLNLSNNLITGNINLNKLKQIEILHLNNNKITSITTSSYFEKTKELYLSNNYIFDTSFLNKFPRIETIDLHSNRIKTLLPIQELIERIFINDSKWQKHSINLSQNPLANPPLEVVSQGNEYVLAYFKQYQAEKDIKIRPYINRDIKLVLVGNSDVGKSTLTEYFLTENWNTTISSTHWMAVKPWSIKYKNQKYNIRIFDFGGQEYYHDTHYLFFTDQTAYLLLWNEQSNKYGEVLIEQRQDNGSLKMNKVQCFPLEYWLNSIEYHTKNKRISTDEKRIREILKERDIDIQNNIRFAENWTEKVIQSTEDIDRELEDVPNILITQNKIDNVHDLKFLNERSLKKSYPKIFEYASLSVKTERGMDNFKEILFELLDKIPLTNKQFLGTWGIVKKEIEIGNCPSKKISITEFKKYCNDIIKSIRQFEIVRSELARGVLFSTTDVISFAQYLNNIGLILYFPENEKLKNYVFLNQKDILQKIYDILLDLHKMNGKFNKDYVKNTLGKSNFDSECEMIINIMSHFKMIFEHPSDVDYYIAPLYLPSEPPKSVKIFLSTFQKPICKFIFNSFIHKHIILEFFQKHGKAVLKDTNNGESYLYWKNGVVLKDIETHEIVLVKFCNVDKANKKAYIDVYKLENSGNSLFSDDVIKTLEEICIDKDVTKTVTVDGENFIPISVIHKAEDNKNWIFHHEEKYYDLKQFKQYLKQDLKMKKIFISYSKEDTPYLVKLENHLSVLKRNGTIDTWNCRQLLPGEKWDGKIKHELEEADIILFLVSDDFLATDYIWDIEIKRAIERENENPEKVKVVPIIVRDCYWEGSPLGAYNSTPGKAQVLTASSNIDLAFKDAVLGIMDII